MTNHVHRLAAAANAAGLVMVVCFAATLSTPAPVPESAVPLERVTSNSAAPRRVALVVIDALRADVPLNPSVMPFACNLVRVRHGRFSIARVDAVIPSTVAGVIALATGDVAPPPAFFRDFGTAASDDGGLFQALAERGDKSFVSGPALWSQLYGRWVDAPYVDPAFGGSDERMLAAGLSTLDDSKYRLVVFHFSRVDEAAHLHGGTSAQYHAAARWCDDAIRQIGERVGSDTTILITSDHGVTEAGGHAGPEADVLNTPLIVWWPGRPAGGRPMSPTSSAGLHQRDVPLMVAEMLGIGSLRPPATETYRHVSRWMFFAMASVACGAAVIVWSTLHAGSDGRPEGFWLSLTFWASLGILIAQHFTAAAFAATLSLVFTAWRTRHNAPLTSRPFEAIASIAIGCAWGSANLWLASRTMDSGLPRAASWVVAIIMIGLALPSLVRRLDGSTLRKMIAISFVGVAIEFFTSARPLASSVAFVAGLLIATAIGLRFQHDARQADDDISSGCDARSGTLAGIGLSVCVAIVSFASGESLSLSSIDVRAPFAVAAHFGIAWAILLAMLQQSLVPAGLAMGALLPLRRGSTPAAGAFFPAISAVFVGQALVDAATYICTADARICSLCLGGLARSAASFTLLMCSAAVVLLVRRLIQLRGLSMFVVPDPTHP